MSAMVDNFPHFFMARIVFLTLEALAIDELDEDMDVSSSPLLLPFHDRNDSTNSLDKSMT